MFSYLFLSLSFLTLWCLVWILRRDLRSKMLRASVIGGIAGLLAELWYLRDYWRPPTLLGIAKLSPEDFLIGFALTGVGMTIYDVLFHTTDAPGERPRRGTFLVLFLLGLGSLFIFSSFLDFNSCIVSEAAFAAAAGIMVIQRRDLLPVALISGMALGLIGFVLYLILFSWLNPSFWPTYWLLAGTPIGKTFIGVPLTEIVWFVTWGMLAGVAPNFTSGMIKVPFSPARPFGATSHRR